MKLALEFKLGWAERGPIVCNEKYTYFLENVHTELGHCNSGMH